jgi:two-component system response regulator WspF
MRIGIVNDAAITREALRRVVLSSSEHELAWLAADGAEAIAMARIDRPDLILMDLIMPGIDGVEATRRIMGESPCAILIVTATISGHLSKVYQAMGYGALDAIDTPTLGPLAQASGTALLLHKIEIIGKLVAKPIAPAAPKRDSHLLASQRAPLFQSEAPLEPLIVMGASTGGPNALAEILSNLPKSLDATIIIVQHVDSAFAPGLGQWLSDQARRQVTLAVDGHLVGTRDILLSGTDDHLVMGLDRRLHYTPEPKALSYRPSVDVFFKSLAQNWPSPGVAVLLTGMGRDGAAGLLMLRRSNWRTITQDESSSVVWGMPKAAVDVGAAEEVLPISQIAGAIARLLRS